MNRLLLAATAAVLLLLTFGAASPAAAHPLGNFTTNRYAGLVVGDGNGTIDYVVDFAEIPTFQQRETIDRDNDGQFGRDELAAAASKKCLQLLGGMRLSVNAVAIPVAQSAASASSVFGQGLATLRVECTFNWTNAPHRGALEFRDSNFAGLIGWQEISAQGDRTHFERTSVPNTSVSSRLTKYPKAQLSSPLQVSSAQLAYAPGGSAARSVATNPLTSRFSGLNRWFTNSVQHRQLTLGLALLAIAAALILGAFHALFPGHGKTVMAAYLVGQRGSTRQGLVLGLTVAVTHTVGVLVLGIVLTATQTFAPESVYPYLGVASGVLFGALGITLLVRAIRQRRVPFAAHSHHHADGHHHHHHPDEHHVHTHGEQHGHAHFDSRNETVGATAPALRTRSLVALGFAGGLVPTPSAVVVLLGATAIGRAWFGVVIVVFYGLGMSATLVAAGLALGWARQRFSIERASERALRVAAALPILTGLVVTGGGVALIARAIGGV